MSDEIDRAFEESRLWIRDDSVQGHQGFGKAMSEAFRRGYLVALARAAEALKSKRDRLISVDAGADLVYAANESLAAIESLSPTPSRDGSERA